MKPELADNKAPMQARMPGRPGDLRVTGRSITGRSITGRRVTAARAAAAAVTAAFAALAGCVSLGQSAPSRLYALELPPLTRSIDCPVSYSVRDLTLAGYLDRLEVVSDRRGNEIQASSSDLWAAPLKDELRRLISLTLSQRWQGSRTVAYPWRFQELPQIALNVSVERLEPSGRSFESLIRWQAFRPADGARQAQVVAAGVHQRSTPMTANSANESVRVMSLAIDQFGDDVQRQLACPVARTN